MIAVKPTVFKKNGKQRLGRGFSREELKKAGISVSDALKLGVPVDLRRRTVHEENVATVKEFLKRKKAESKPKRRGKSKS
ncbi:MAG: ribosomal protein L13e [Candidatus Bathyarchaeia archaeon]